MFKRRSILPLLLVAAASGCDDSTAPEPSRLSATEAEALAVALDNSSSRAVEPDAAADGSVLALHPGAPDAAVGTHNTSLDVTVPCPRGGTARLHGEHELVIDTDEGSITVDVVARQDHEACVFRTGEGIDVTIEGSVDFEAVRDLREGLASASQSHSGSLDFSTSDGKSGTCLIDLTTGFLLEPGSATRTILGSVCGHPVEETTTWAGSAES